MACSEAFSQVSDALTVTPSLIFSVRPCSCRPTVALVNTSNDQLAIDSGLD